MVFSRESSYRLVLAIIVTRTLAYHSLRDIITTPDIDGAVDVDSKQAHFSNFVDLLKVPVTIQHGSSLRRCKLFDGLFIHRGRLGG